MPGPGLSVRFPEARLLFLCVRRSEHDQEILRLLEKGLDWALLLALAQREKAELILWRRLKDLGWEGEGKPGEAMARLAQVWEFKLARLESLFRDTLSAFHQAGIDVVLLKGSGTAYTAFEGFTDRPMFDVDLLVRPDSAEMAWTVAQECGWRWDAREYPKESYGTAHHLPPLDDGAGSGVGLDLHTSLWMEGYPFRFSEADIWREARTMRIPGVSGAVKAPTTLHQFLHACLHLSWSHGMEKYAWQGFREIGGISRQEDMSWPEAILLSRKAEAGEFTYWPLRLGVAACGLDIPRDALESLRPGKPPWVLRVLERHFLSGYSEIGLSSPSDAFSRHVWRFAMGTGASRGRVFLPRDHDPMPVLGRVGNQLRSLPAWVRYLRRLLRP